MVVRGLPKAEARVRFPLPAPISLDYFDTTDSINYINAALAQLVEQWYRKP